MAGFYGRTTIRSRFGCNQGGSSANCYTPAVLVFRQGCMQEKLRSLRFQDNKGRVCRLKRQVYAWFYLLIQRQLQPGGARQELTRQDSTRCGVFIFQLGFLHCTNTSCIMVCWNDYRKPTSPCSCASYSCQCKYGRRHLKQS